VEQQLIALYLLVCRAYDTEPDLKYQRLSNFKPRCTDQELATMYLFGWLIQRTDIQNASRVRSTKGLLVHCYGKLAVACLLLTFNS